MNELSSLGLILLFALAAGHLVKFLRIPEVTGYILAGVAVGPSGLGWVNERNLSAVSVFSEVALGLILFSIGAVFEFSRFRRIGPRVVRVTLIEAVLTGLLVSTAMLMLGMPWQAALLLGVIAMETAPASTLMVIREMNATGPLSETLTGIIGLNNVFCLVTFFSVAALLELRGSILLHGGVVGTWMALFSVVWQIVGSLALGYLIGLLLASWASQVLEHGEMLILLIGAVLLAVGVALVLQLSTLMTSLTLGATVVNLSRHTTRMMRALSRTDPPFYAIFFVIAGAGLDLGLLKTMGVLGAAYVTARALGKIAGGRFGARRVDLGPAVERLLGFSILSQAGLAVGLTLAVGHRFPALGPAISTVVLAAIAIFELVGPVGVRYAIVRAGEAQPRVAEAGGEAVGLLD